jgi:hypothetical protein
MGSDPSHSKYLPLSWYKSPHAIIPIVIVTTQDEKETDSPSKINSGRVVTR